MNKYIEISVDEAYRLFNHGPLVLISTRSAESEYNIAPIAWNCPVRKTPTRILLVVGRSHKTYENIKKTGQFIVCVPSFSAAEFVRYSGSVSGTEENKFKKRARETIVGEKVDALIPEGMVGYMECILNEEFRYDSVSLIIGETIKAGADEEGFSGRVRPENEKGRTLHHLGGGEFGVLSSEVNSGK